MWIERASQNIIRIKNLGRLQNGRVQQSKRIWTAFTATKHLAKLSPGASAKCKDEKESMSWSCWSLESWRSYNDTLIGAI